MQLQIFIYTLMALLTFTTWTITTRDTQDPKIIVALISFTIISVLSINTNKPSQNIPSKISLKQITPFLMFVALQAYMFTYWYISPYQYTATQYLAILWTSSLSLIVGVTIGNQQGILDIIIKGIVGIGTIAALYGFLEYWGVIPCYDQSLFFPPHISGHVGHKNTLGFLLMIAVLCNTYFLLEKQSKLYYISFPIIVITLLISDSRGSQILALLGIILLLLPYILRGKLLQSKKSKIILTILVIGIIGIPLFLWDQSTLERFTTLFTKGDGFRKAVWTAQWKMFLDAPLLGHGMGSFTHKSPEYWPEWFKATSAFTHTIYSGHNEFLEILCQFGILGSLLYFFFWGVALYNGIKLLSKSWNYKVFLLLVLLITIISHSLISVASRKAPSMFLQWILVGYFWHQQFRKGTFAWYPQMKNYSILIISMLSIVVFLTFSALLRGDYYYKKATLQKKVTKEDIELYSIGLKISPNNHWILNQLTHISIETKQYEYAQKLINELEKSAPNHYPTSLYKARIHIAKSELEQALGMVEKHLAYHKKDLKGIELKTYLFAQMNKCTELQELKREHVYLNERYEERHLTAFLGPIRTKFSQKYLKDDFNKYTKFLIQQHQQQLQLYTKISAQKCDDKK